MKGRYKSSKQSKLQARRQLSTGSQGSCSSMSSAGSAEIWQHQFEQIATHESPNANANSTSHVLENTMTSTLSQPRTSKKQPPTVDPTNTTLVKSLPLIQMQMPPQLQQQMTQLQVPAAAAATQTSLDAHSSNVHTADNIWSKVYGMDGSSRSRSKTIDMTNDDDTRRSMDHGGGVGRSRSASATEHASSRLPLFGAQQRSAKSASTSPNRSPHPSFRVPSGQQRTGTCTTSSSPPSWNISNTPSTSSGCPAPSAAPPPTRMHAPAGISPGMSPLSAPPKLPCLPSPGMRGMMGTAVGSAPQQYLQDLHLAAAMPNSATTSISTADYRRSHVLVQATMSIPQSKSVSQSLQAISEQGSHNPFAASSSYIASASNGPCTTSDGNQDTTTRVMIQQQQQQQQRWTMVQQVNEMARNSHTGDCQARRGQQQPQQHLLFQQGNSNMTTNNHEDDAWLHCPFEPVDTMPLESFDPFPF